MAKVTGLQVILKANTGTPESPTYTVVGGQKDGSINITGDAIDVSSKDGDGWKEFLLGLKGWDMDLDGVIKENDAGAQALIDAFFNGDEILVKAEFPDGSFYSGNAVVVSMPIKAPMGGDATFTFKIQGTGALTPVTATVTAPTITEPTADDTAVVVTGPFTTSAFAYSTGSDTHAATQWQITTNADTTFEAPIVDDESTKDLVSKKIAATLLSAGTQYRIRARHKGTLLGWSAWSTVHHFTTAS
jgi:TP901-1 family phage major tail protein